MLHYNSITDAPTVDQFRSLNWPDKQRVLDAITVLSCEQCGKSYDEAQRKRKPIDLYRETLQNILDNEVQAWIAKG